MTFSQEARTEGFLAQLELRGQTLLLKGVCNPVRALFEKAEPEQAQHQIEREVANATIIHVLRSHLADAGLNPVVGEHWYGANDTRYRIRVIRDQDVEIAVVFHCDTSRAP